MFLAALLLPPRLLGVEHPTQQTLHALQEALASCRAAGALVATRLPNRPGPNGNGDAASCPRFGTTGVHLVLSANLIGPAPSNGTLSPKTMRPAHCTAIPRSGSSMSLAAFRIGRWHSAVSGQQTKPGHAPWVRHLPGVLRRRREPVPVLSGVHPHGRGAHAPRFWWLTLLDCGVSRRGGRRPGRRGPSGAWPTPGLRSAEPALC